MNIRELIRPWVIIAALLGALGLFGGLFLLLGGVPSSAEHFAGEAALTVIPAPTPTPTPPPVVLPEEPTPIPSPGEQIEIGSYVQVSGTGGDGLRIRSQHTLDGDVNCLGLEDEVFIVIAGPNLGDGYTWWHLESPSDQTRNGWAVSDYLQVINNQE
ncbi:MAG: hypothetical protein U9O54_03215 [Chloroflexota bacterium]|nr:hypothetical protein [Chloroflexota bacterium]